MCYKVFTVGRFCTWMSTCPNTSWKDSFLHGIELSLHLWWKSVARMWCPHLFIDFTFCYVIVGRQPDMSREGVGYFDQCLYLVRWLLIFYTFHANSSRECGEGGYREQTCQSWLDPMRRSWPWPHFQINYTLISILRPRPSAPPQFQSDHLRTNEGVTLFPRIPSLSRESPTSPDESCTPA